MLIPKVLAGMKQARQIACFRVKPSNISTFVTVALVARQTQVGHLIQAIMLDGDDVINMKCYCAATFE